MHDNLPESSFQGDGNLIKIAHPFIKSQETSYGFRPIFFTFPVCGDCDAFFPSNSSVFHFFQVLGAKKAAFKSDSGNCFMNSLNCFGIFLVFETNLKKGTVSTWFSNFGQNLALVDLRKLGKSHEKLFVSPSTQGKPQVNSQQQLQ